MENASVTIPSLPPVLLIAFNRPWHTARVWKAIRKVMPNRLLVAIDAPRKSEEKDHDACRAVHQLVRSPDWPCEFSLLSHRTHRGCRHGPAEAITWAFSKVDHLIILEDDCIPDPTFFLYCSELIARYEKNHEIMGIGGHRWEGPDIQTGASYYTSNYPNTWGWASWANRWREFDLNMTAWPALRERKWLQTRLEDAIAVTYWERNFNAMENGLDAWDVAWLFACWRIGGLWIRPNVNMVHNIGFGANATHTHQLHHPASKPAGTMMFPLCHPGTLQIDPGNELLIEWVNFSGMLKRQLKEGSRQIKALNRIRHQK